MDSRPPETRLPLVRRVTCPHCLHRFGPDECLWVAISVGAEGVGPTLGDDGLRFRAERFDVLGEALDPHGAPTSRFACPSCYREIPRAFFQHRPFLASVVGGRSVGKSSLVAALVWTLRAHGSGFVLVDAEASWNVDLHKREHDLFVNPPPALVRMSASDRASPAGAGDPAHETRVCESSRPLVFLATPENSAALESARRATRIVAIYEHSGSQLLGTGGQDLRWRVQLASADLTVFVYDPTQDGRFVDQAVSEEGSPPQHSVLQAAAVAHVAGIDHAPHGTLVFVVAKADRWIDFVTCGPADDAAPASSDWLDSWLGGVKTFDAIDRVSHGLRQMLMDKAPEIISIAERHYRHVTYVPSSIFRCQRRVNADDGESIIVKSSMPEASWCEIPLLVGLRACGGRRPTERPSTFDAQTSSPVTPSAVMDAAGRQRTAADGSNMLLRTHRMLAIARAPLRLRIQTLRKLVEREPGHEGWRLDLRGYEQVVKDQLGNELKGLAALKGTADLRHAESIVRELADAEWQAPLGSGEIRELQELLAHVRAATTHTSPRSPGAESHGGTHVGKPSILRGSGWGQRRLRRSVLFTAGILIVATLMSRPWSLLWREHSLSSGDPPGQGSVEQKHHHGQADRLDLIDGLLNREVASSIRDFESESIDAPRPSRTLESLRKSIESELADVARLLQGLESDFKEAVEPRADANRSDVSTRYDELRRRFNEESDRFRNLLIKRGKIDDAAIVASLDRLEVAGSRESGHLLGDLDRLLVAAEAANGEFRAAFRDRLREIKDQRSTDHDRQHVEQALDQAIQSGIETFVAVLEASQQRLSSADPGLQVPVFKVLDSRRHYRSALAWADVAQVWENPAFCSADEARGLRSALHHARQADAHASDEHEWEESLSLLDQHLQRVEQGFPRAVGNLYAYLTMPVMDSGVRQTAHDGRIFYWMNGETPVCFVDEETTKPLAEAMRLQRADGSVPAKHLRMVDEMRGVLRPVMDGTKSVDEAVVSALGLLSDAAMIGEVDPILLCRLDCDVLTLAASRPLFTATHGLIDAQLERLHERLGVRPRWVWSVQWSNAQSWEIARASARGVAPSSQALRRVAESCMHKADELAQHPPFARRVKAIGWIGARGGHPTVRGSPSQWVGQRGRLLVVRREENDAWQYTEIGALEHGDPVLSPEADTVFGEPVFLEPATARRGHEQ